MRILLRWLVWCASRFLLSLFVFCMDCAAVACVVPTSMSEGEQMIAACRVEMELLNMKFTQAPIEAKADEARPNRCVLRSLFWFGDVDLVRLA